MKDVMGFCKMFDLNIPSFEEFGYYKSQFSRLERWKDLDRSVALYEQAESEIEDMFAYRMAKIEEIVDFIRESRAYQDLCDENLLPDYPTSKSYEYEEGKIYLSIDLKKANWQSVKWHDPVFINELGDTYEDMLDKFGVPEVFKHSKHFRQYIFGNLNPKKQMKMQRVILEHVIGALSRFGMKLEFTKHDEACYSVSSLSEAARVVDQVGGQLHIKDGILPEVGRFPKIEAGAKIFYIKKADDFRINQYLCLKSGDMLHSEPVGCSGHRFFMALRKHVFNEPYDVRDLYFRMDGQLAMWKVDGLKVEL
jgi:hypothetical protein